MIERDSTYECAHGDALADELVKIAGIGGAVANLMKKTPQRGLSAINKGRLAGTAIGAGVGAAGGASADPEDRVAGGLRGAIMGGVAGLGAGQLATRAGRAQTKRFGQRQLHGMTGYLPRSAAQKAKGVGWAGGGMSTKERLKALGDMGVYTGEKITPLNQGSAVRAALKKQTITKNLSPGMRKRLAELDVASLKAQREAAEKGLTSLPGVAKGMVRNPLGTLKTGLLSQGALGVGLAGIPIVADLPGAVKGDEGAYSDEGGLGRLVGENIGYTALGAVPFAPMMAGAALAGKAGELAHKKLSRRPGAVVTPPQQDQYYND